MTVDLPADTPAPAIPAGVEITGFADERSADVLLVKNEAFRDHWGSADTTPDSFAFYLESKSFRAEFSFVAYVRAEPIGMILAEEDEAYNKAKSVRNLYISQWG